MKPEVLRNAIDKFLACPACEGGLAIAGDFASLTCVSCAAVYSITDGIPVMLPNRPSVQEDELSFRDSQASQYSRALG